MKINDFKSNLSDLGGGASPALFEVTLPETALNWGNSSDSILVKSTNIPESTLEETAVNYAGRAYKYDGYRTYGTWDTTVFNKEDYGVRESILEWMIKLAGNLDGKRERDNAYDSMFEENIKVTQISRGGEKAATYELYNAWPSTLAEMPITWDTTDFQEFAITWTYDYWKKIN